MMVCHQPAEPLSESEISTVFKSINGVEKNRFVNTKRPGGINMPPVQDAIAAGVIRALFGGVGNAADRAKRRSDKANAGIAVGTEGMSPALQQDFAAGQAERREEQFREGCEQRRHITSPWGAI